MAATLKLTRRGTGIELRRRPFDVEIDGAATGSVAVRATVQIPIGPGRHTLRLRSGRYTSPERSFDAVDGETVDFRCHAVLTWATYLASLVRPDLGITLGRE